MRRLLLLVLLLPACDLLLPPAAPLDGARPPRDRDECDDDDDCDGGEECDDGDCVDIEPTEGEGEGGEGEGEPPPPPLPVCGAIDCPEILSLSSNLTTLGEFDNATVSAVVTDPDGVADLIGGVLLDPVSDSTYGAFNSTGAGTFTISVSWNSLGPVRTIDFDGSATRVVRARFFDQAGNEAFGDLTFTLRCDEDDGACDGRCGAERCNGTCLSGEDLSSDANCGGCGVSCVAPEECTFVDAINEFGCECPGGECTTPEPGTRYSGTAEDGVVCNGDVCDTCCLGFDQTFGCDDGSGNCLFTIATCDGPEDCAGGEECCESGFQASCVETGVCRANGNREVCVRDSDCIAGELCCTSDQVIAAGLDGGVCSVAEAGQCPAIAGPPPAP